MFSDQVAYIQLGNVRVGVEGAAEMDEKRPLVSVPRSEVVKLEGVHTIAGERPLAMFLIGIALLAVSVVPVAALIDVLMRGGVYHVEWIAAVACIIPATWLIQLSVRRKWVLVVTTRRGRRKLLFPSGITQAEVESFTAQAKDRYGYS